MSGKVLAISYATENKALYYANQEYCNILRRVGYDAKVFDASTSGGIEELYRLIHTENYQFCIGLQGVGSRLTLDGQSLWSERKIPFVGIHYDHPCYNILNHTNSSPYVANLYCFESLRETHNKYIATNQVVNYLPYEIFPPPEASIPYNERPIKFLFVKTGQRPDECIEMINGLPSHLRDGVWEKIEVMQRNPNLLVCDIIQSVFDALKIERSSNFDLFWGITHWVDKYIRRKRASDFVQWLQYQEGAVIVGDGWDFIDKMGSRAIFKPSMVGTEAFKLYGQTQYMCNVNPYGRDVIHERSVFGLFENCKIISDKNAWWDKHFGDNLNVFLFDWNQPLSDQLKPIMSDNDRLAEPTPKISAFTHFVRNQAAEKILGTVGAVKKLAEEGTA